MTAAAYVGAAMTSHLAALAASLAAVLAALLAAAACLGDSAI